MACGTQKTKELRQIRKFIEALYGMFVIFWIYDICLQPLLFLSFPSSKLLLVVDLVLDREDYIAGFDPDLLKMHHRERCLFPGLCVVNKEKEEMMDMVRKDVHGTQMVKYIAEEIICLPRRPKSSWQWPRSRRIAARDTQAPYARSRH